MMPSHSDMLVTQYELKGVQLFFFLFLLLGFTPCKALPAATMHGVKRKRRKVSKGHRKAV